MLGLIKAALPVTGLACEVLVFLYVAHSFHIRGWSKPIRSVGVLVGIFILIVTSIHEYAHYNMELNKELIRHEEAAEDREWCNKNEGKKQRYKNGTKADCDTAKLTLLNSPEYDAWVSTWARWTGLSQIFGFAVAYWMHAASVVGLFFVFRYFYPAGNQAVQDMVALYRLKMEMKNKATLGAQEWVKVVQ